MVGAALPINHGGENSNVLGILSVARSFGIGSTRNTVNVVQSPVARPTMTAKPAWKLAALSTVPKVAPNCPATTQNCVPCNAGEAYCRYLPGETTGYKGWACQNNNPGNIRYSTFRNNLISGQGATPACGERNGYMVFGSYNKGKEGLKAYVRAINAGQHSSYRGTYVVNGVTHSWTCGDCNLKQFFSVYAPAGDQNDPNSYANNVANRIGVNADTTTISWIVNNKLDEFVAAIQIQEGWFTY